jgi:hypothetical protein
MSVVKKKGRGKFWAIFVAKAGDNGNILVLG